MTHVARSNRKANERRRQEAARKQGDIPPLKIVLDTTRRKLRVTDGRRDYGFYVTMARAERRVAQIENSRKPPKR